MKKIIYHYCCLAALVLIHISCASKKTSSGSDQFVGDWYTIKGDVEAYSFYLDSARGVYSGSLHDRPVVKGSWKVENNKLVLTPEYETGNSKPIIYEFMLKSDTLYLNNGEEIYTKTVPLYINYPELEILEKIKWDVGLKFDQPVPAKLNWHDGTFEGYSVIIVSKLGSDDMAGIYGCLQSNGFLSDSLMVSEICSGYIAEQTQGQILLTACTAEDPEATDGKFTITLTVAKKK
jgi:hypothetical protein